MARRGRPPTPKPCWRDRNFAERTVALWNMNDDQWRDYAFKHRGGLANNLHILIRDGDVKWDEAYGEGESK